MSIPSAYGDGSRNQRSKLKWPRVRRAGKLGVRCEKNFIYSEPFCIVQFSSICTGDGRTRFWQFGLPWDVQGALLRYMLIWIDFVFYSTIVIIGDCIEFPTGLYLWSEGCLMLWLIVLVIDIKIRRELYEDKFFCSCSLSIKGTSTLWYGTVVEEITTIKGPLQFFSFEIHEAKKINLLWWCTHKRWLILLYAH